MNSKRFAWVWGFSLACCACSASAQNLNLEETKAYQWIMEAGLNNGGDNIAKGTYSNTGTSWDVKAGKGWQGGLGVQYAFNELISSQFTVGYLVDTTNGLNGDVAFKRVPVELMLTYNINNRWRWGGGWHQSFKSKRENTGVAAFLGGETFTSDPGAVVQVAYFFKPYQNFKKTGQEISSGLGLRYVSEKFTSEKTQKTYQADHLGVFFMMYF